MNEPEKVIMYESIVLDVRILTNREQLNSAVFNLFLIFSFCVVLSVNPSLGGFYNVSVD